MNIGEVLSKELSDSVTTAVVLVSGPSEMVLEFRHLHTALLCLACTSYK